MSQSREIEKSKLQQKEIFFQGKHVVITGGGSGIGKALAERFSQLGAQVSVIDISAPSEFPENVLFRLADVSDQSALESQATDEKIDILIIAAGVTSRDKEATSEEEMLMDAVNVNGVKNTLAVFEPRLVATARVVYVGTHNPPKPYYAKTKQLGKEFIEQFAQQHPVISTHIIYLGPVRTPLFENGKPEEVIQRIENEVGLYEPQEFAEELIDELLLTASTVGLNEKTMYKQRQ